MSKHAERKIHLVEEAVPDPEGYEFVGLTVDDEQNLAEFAQGHVLQEVKRIPLVSGTGESVDYPTPHGVAILTQTCDVVVASSSRRTVQVAPIVELTGAKADEARRGKRPQYLYLPALGEEYFADLEVVATLEKAHIASQSGRQGVEGELQARRFGQGAGRKYSRFPFPNEVVPWLAPLEEIVVSKHDDERKSESWALQQVREMRIASDNGWSGPRYDLKLYVILNPGVLPVFPDDELPDQPGHVREWLYDDPGRLKRQPGEIAGLLSTSADPVTRYWLWMGLADAWAEKCRPKGRHRANPAVTEAVRSIVAEIYTADDFTLTMYDSSELLDVDHLSAPRFPRLHN